MLPKMDYISDGIIKQENFGQVEVLEEFKDNQFNSCNGNITGETGNLGVTYMPLDNTVGKGPIDGTSIDININPTLSQLGAAEAFLMKGMDMLIFMLQQMGTGTKQYIIMMEISKQMNILKSVQLRLE